MDSCLRRNDSFHVVIYWIHVGKGMTGCLLFINWILVFAGMTNIILLQSVQVPWSLSLPVQVRNPQDEIAFRWQAFLFPLQL